MYVDDLSIWFAAFCMSVAKRRIQLDMTECHTGLVHMGFTFLLPTQLPCTSAAIGATTLILTYTCVVIRYNVLTKHVFLVLYSKDV